MRQAFLIIILLFWAGAIQAGTRYGLFIGKNNGGKSRPPLKYSHHDVRNLQATLAETGDLRRENTVILLEPDIRALRQNLKSFARMLAEKQGGAREVFFYYSGHSNEHGLLIDNSVLEYADLRSWIQDLPSEVNIVILDSCSSGSLARLKGGKKVLSSIIAETTDHRGTAILASSSSSEDSQESDQLRGSFFTHNLIAGLRGAADLNRDSRVSLHEAYTYSYEETLANTLKSGAGPQHPYFDFRVSGHGELTVSDLNRSASQLVFGGNIQGLMYIFDSNNRLALKLNKTSTSPLAVSIHADKFLIRIFRDKTVLESEIHLKTNERKKIDFAQFSALPENQSAEVKQRYNSSLFFSTIVGPSFHFFMPGAGKLRNYDLADLGYTGRIMAGIKLRNETAVYFTGALGGMKNLTKSSGDTSPIIINAGVGARYHFYPSGFYVGGSANAAWNRISVTQDFGRGPETLRYASGLGFGLELNAGMEWKLANDLGLGISWFSYFGAVYGGSSSDPRFFADQVQNVVIGIMVSLTYF